uniref:Putative extracellular protein CSOL_088 n=1 Tax=Pseudococcomyxa simplex TaxID=464287 RepID=A0A7L9QE93_9CHLO|nr:putative extracellular protein CSOL_088 [Pseudococcomyxa simplex]
MTTLKFLALVATAALLCSSARGDDFSLETLGETIRTALLNLAGVPPTGTPVNVGYNKTIGGDDGLGLALNVTGVVHGPNGTAIKETDTTTLGGADNYKKIHDSHGVVGPKQIDLGGGKNTFLDNKNSSAGYGAGATFNKDSTFNVGGGGQAKIKDVSAGGGGGINNSPDNKNSSAGYGAGATFNKDSTFNVGGGGQATIKDVSVGGGVGINKVAPGGNSTGGSQYYSPYAPPAVPSTP